MIASSRRSLILTFLLAAGLLAGMFGLALGSAPQKSPTVDEGLYIARGWAYWRTGHLLPLGHPPLTNMISGLGVLMEPNLPDPATLDGWQENDAERVSRDLLWGRGLDASRIVWLARLPTIFLGLLAAALIWRWAWGLYGRRAATLALALCALSPTLLAHSQLATTDLGVAAFYVAALYTWARFLRRPRWRWLWISGVTLGLAQASKFSALLLIPTLGAMALWRAWMGGAILPAGIARWESLTRRRAGALASALVWSLAIGAIGLAVLWAAHFFSLQPLATGGYVAEFQHFLELAGQGHRAYALGIFSDTGWWWYHPFTMAVKLTLPELAALAAATGLALFQPIRPREWETLFPAGAYLAFSMTLTLNVGIRYLLPVILLLFVFASRLAAGKWLESRWRVAATLLIAGGQLATALAAHPHYLAYFNEAAGGRDNGLRLLADSNLDWGQDLPGLAEYLHSRGDPIIYLSYFGHADPSYYGIQFMALPGWPPPVPKPEFYPLNPAPGLYAISASNLVGAPPWPFDADTFAYFRNREPIARIGASLYVYEVPADTGALTWIAQCAAPDPVEQAETLAKLAGSQTLTQFYFDCLQSLPIPEGRGWIVLPPDIRPIVDLGEPNYVARRPDGSARYQAWSVSAAPPAPESSVIAPPLTLPIPVADHLELMGYQLSAREASAGDTLTVTAWWRVRQPPPPPVSILAHLVPANSDPFQPPALVGDTLGARAEDWQPGMILIQRHFFPIGPEIASGDYQIVVALYSLTTGQRFRISDTADQIVLAEFRVIDGAR